MTGAVRIPSRARWTHQGEHLPLLSGRSALIALVACAGLQGRPVAAGEMTEADAEEVRLRRIQEKNRRNQRKFRARQRVRTLTRCTCLTPHPHVLLLRCTCIYCFYLTTIES